MFEHHHQIVYRQNDVTNSLSVGLEHLKLDRQGKLKQGYWGILSILPDLYSFSFISPDSFPILAKIDRPNYRSLITQ